MARTINAYDEIKNWYNNTLNWLNKSVLSAVNDGKITEEEYEKITGNSLKTCAMAHPRTELLWAAEEYIVRNWKKLKPSTRIDALGLSKRAVNNCLRNGICSLGSLYRTLFVGKHITSAVQNLLDNSTPLPDYYKRNCDNKIRGIGPNGYAELIFELKVAIEEEDTTDEN